MIYKEEKIDDTKGIIQKPKVDGKWDKQRSTKHYTENKRLNQKHVQIISKDRSFQLHIQHGIAILCLFKIKIFEFQ